MGMAHTEANSLPAGPLFDFLARQGLTTQKAIALALGVHQRQVVRWRGGVRLWYWRADQLAVRCGVHPADIWGDLWWVAA